MQLLIGFGVGLVYGCLLFWETLKQFDDVRNENEILRSELRHLGRKSATDRVQAQGGAVFSRN